MPEPYTRKTRLTRAVAGGDGICRDGKFLTQISQINMNLNHNWSRRNWMKAEGTQRPQRIF
jgi:hypothetical protein